METELQEKEAGEFYWNKTLLNAREWTPDKVMSKILS